MKRKLLILICSLPLLSFAQSLNFGAKAGINLPLITYSGIKSPDVENCPAFAAFIEIGSDRSKLEIEASHIWIKSDFITEGNAIINYGYKLDYSTLLWTASFKHYATDNFAVSLGGYVGLTTTENNIITASSIDYDAKELANNGEYGLAVGMQLYIYKGLFVDSKLTFNLNNNGIRATYLIFSTGYKF